MNFKAACMLKMKKVYGGGCVCMWCLCVVWMPTWMAVCVCKEAEGGHLVSCSVTLYLTPLRRGLSSAGLMLGYTASES